MKKFFLTTIFYLICIHIFANGGPIDGSAVVKTGRIKMINKNDIKLTSEVINLTIDGDYAIYDITYTFYKENIFADTVTYGFPIDFTLSNDFDVEEISYNEDYVSYFKMFFNKQALPIEQQIDFNLVFDTVGFYAGYDEEQRLVPCKRKWYISKMVFDDEGVYELNVQYKVKNFFTDMLYSDSFLPRYSNRYLRYDLTPAVYWQDGIIDSFTLKIDVRNLDNCKETYNLYGISDAKYNNGFIEYQKNDFAINSIKYFLFKYTNSIQKFSEYVVQNKIDNQNIIAYNSSDKANLFDFNFTTGFKIKQGDSIEIDLKSIKTAAIFLLNGDYSSAENFENKNKLSKIRVSSDYTYTDIWGIRHKLDTIIQLNNFNYFEISESNFAQNLEMLWDFGMDSEFGKITITVLEAVKNEEDVCVAEIIFVSDFWSE